jgi:hypothetical protein
MVKSKKCDQKHRQLHFTESQVYQICTGLTNFADCKLNTEDWQQRQRGEELQSFT